ncbi:hypothetical protein [Lignipirellula cremea]|uniref:Serine protease n=1 Tax=Lignipirellula cremea TaxID=2528010 RepID=A0A518E2A3_9BACT|nr:hypothetical protein [Lignipirellula cremea]QDU98203.1 hypothetical protein Pla8534_60640 [Lignipirellula cremea]
MFRSFCYAGLSFLLLGRLALAAPPAITNVDLRGLQSGGVVTLTLTGSDLMPDPQLVLSLAKVEQKLLPGAAANKVQFEVKVPAAAEAGLYNVRVATGQGVSNAVVVAVDGLPESAVAEQAASLPIAMHGALAGSARQVVRFTGQAGQEILCEVEANRLGGKLRPVLHLYEPSGRHLAWSLPSPLLEGDTRLSAKLPVDGEYRVELHDLQYASPAPNFYRLKIGSWAFADIAWPPTVGEEPADVALIGNLPQPITRTAAADDRSPQPAAWPQGMLASGPRVVIRSSLQRQLLEQESPNAATTDLGSAPVAACGRLLTANEQDRFQLQVTPGSNLKLAVQAAVLGSPIDAMIEVQNEKGGKLAGNDDANGSPDPELTYTVPKEVETLWVVVSDALGRGGPTHVYRLLVSLADEPAAPDFTLRFEDDRLQVARGQFSVLPVQVDRTQFTGPIELRLSQLPPGVTCAVASAEGDADGALLLVQAAAGSSACLVTRLVGATNTQELTAVRTGRNGTSPLVNSRPWLASELAVAAYQPDVPFTIDWEKTDEPVRLVLGAKLTLPVVCQRPVGADGPVRLTLLTSQTAPQNNGRVDPNRTLRTEAAAVEIPADSKAQAAFNAVEAADKVLAAAEQQRVAAEAAKPVDEAKLAAAKQAETVAAEKKAAADKAAEEAAAAANNTLPVPILAPGDLTASAYQLAFKAELLSRDKRQVLATAYTPIVRHAAINPLAIEPAETSYEAQLAASGAVVKVAGKVLQSDGMKGDITVTLEGLPAGVPVPRVIVKADQTDFEFDVRFPASHMPGELTDVRLTASGKYDAAARVLVSAPPVPLRFDLLPPATESK